MKKREEHTLLQDGLFRPFWWFLFLSPFAFGMYYEFLSCIASVFLCGYCVVLMRKQRRLTLCLSFESGVLLLLTMGYLLTTFWAVDKGMAWLGFLKFFPLLPFWYIWTQLSVEQREKMFLSIPLSGITMTLLSYPTRWIEGIEPYFFSAQRLGGFFQYSNTFALYLLLGILILAWDKRALWQRLIGIAVLVFGILVTGSRTVFFLLLLGVGMLCIQNKKIRWPLLGITAALILVGALAAAVTGNTQTIGRFVTSSLTSSTLLGRILYALDALPVIVQHPFGLGYLGYYYLQSTFQTGTYVVRFVHNEYLQLFLDVGWIPAMGFLVVLVKNLFSKRTATLPRMLLILMAIHLFLDFDLQFLSVFFVLLMTLNCHGGKEKQVSLPKMVRSMLYAACGALCGLFLYFGWALFASYRGDHQRALELYPLNTTSQTALLAQAPSAQAAEELADAILAHNPYIPLAYDAKALVSTLEGDYDAMMAYKDQSISIARYTLDEYIDYVSLLQRALEECLVRGDQEQAKRCREKLEGLPGVMQSVVDGTRPLAWKLDETPQLTLPQEMLDYIDGLDG